MIVFFRKLPLTIKLMLIGFLPVLLLIYFSVIIFEEKSQKVNYINDYIEHVDQFSNLGELISELGNERRYSYQYILKNESYDKVLQQRKKTDSLIHILEKSPDLSLEKFTKYTFLDNLAQTRKAIDTSREYDANDVIQYYTDAIFRLNTLNSTTPSSNTFLKPVLQDLISQKILSEMITYLGIIRTNIFNALYTKEYIRETLFGTLGVYKVYKTYETEFLLKASPESIKLYEKEMNSPAFKPTITYVDKVFTNFKFDSTYDAEHWWQLSSEGINVLRKQQSQLWHSVEIRMKEIYERERKSKMETFFLIAFTILFVISFVAFTINDISKLLREIKFAARKISKGGTGLQLRNMPKGVIGNLAKSISQIDKNNLMLAEAASEIGKGNFNVIVKARSDEDLLGISIKKMKRDLREFASQKDRIQKETEELVHKREEFFSIASHELKTPVTSLKAFTQILLMEAQDNGDSRHSLMLKKMDLQINKLTSLINDLLDTSKLQNGQLVYKKHPFKLNELITEIIEEIQATTSEHQLIFNSNADSDIFGDRDRIGQVLNNLLTNAIKYAPNSKEIIVELNREDDKIICSVHDSGNGIQPDEHAKIFERFYRISGNNLHTYPGLGLGLFISKEIIEKHNGKMWLQSKPGEGSIFYFELPVN